MNALNKSYYQDVTTFTDEELNALSAEMQEAFEHNDGEGGYWSDDEAETRYYEMQAELRLRHPRVPGPFDAVIKYYCGETLKALARSIDLSHAADAAFVAGNLKIGETLTVRKPYRFNA